MEHEDGTRLNNTLRLLLKQGQIECSFKDGEFMFWMTEKQLAEYEAWQDSRKDF